MRSNTSIKEKIDDLTDIVNSFKKLIESLKGLWILILPIIGFVTTLFNLKKVRDFLINHNILSQNVVDFIYNNSNGIISILLLIALIFLIILIRKTGKKELTTSNATYNMVNKLHNEFVHKLRDGISNLYLKNERVIELRNQNNIEAIKEVQGRAFDNLIIDLQCFVDLISDYLSSYNKDTISTCIKIINSDQDNIDDLNKTARTLVRSKNTKRKRIRSNENVTLGKNTDFKYLCDGTNIWYHSADLKTKFNNGEYENEAKTSDWQGKYNSTIVVPIRHYNIENNNNDILGFICIDSQNIMKNWDNESSFELQFLAIFADLIYTYIKLFRRLFDER